MDKGWSSSRVFPVVIFVSVSFFSLAIVAEAATVLTVGPDGAYATIQSAIDAAVVGRATQIHVQGGGRTYTETLQIPNSFSSGSILLFGGWDDGFIIHQDEPETTIIDGGGVRVMDISPGGGTFEMRNFTLTNGQAAQGAGAHVAPLGNAVVVLRKLRISGNTATSTTDALGGGMWAVLDNSQQLTLIDCNVEQNQAVSTGGGLANGGGMGIIASGSSKVILQFGDVEENYVETSGASSAGAGMLLELSGSSEALIENMAFVGNTGTNSRGQVMGVGSWVVTRDSAALEVAGNAWAFNEGVGTDVGAQFESWHQEQSRMRLAEAGLVQGDRDGAVVQAADTSVVNLVNLTVADHPGSGLSLTTQGGNAELTLFNTIAYGNGTDLTTSGTVVSGSNLIGVDPLFVDPSSLDYHLQADSLADGSGDGNPPGGLSVLDLDGFPRVRGGAVDIGVYEGVGQIFTDAFEMGDTSEWSLEVP